jgi:hypothetical protein
MKTKEVYWEEELTNHLPFKIYYNPKKDFIWSIYQNHICFLMDCPKGYKPTKKEISDPEGTGNIFIGYLNEE